MIFFSKKNIARIVLLGCCFFFGKCSSENVNHVVTNINSSPFKTLSEYQFFIGKIKNLSPNEGVLPYDLNSPLFSDYAEKSRFLWMPKGTSTRFTTEGVLDFPEGTILIKTFFYSNDQRNPEAGKKLLETRLLIKNQSEWEAHSYIWNEEQTEAHLEIVGGIQPIEWVDQNGISQKVDYLIPNKNQCKGCHAYKGKLIPIGPKVRNLNKTFTYPDGKQNQLKKWASVGYLIGYDPSTSLPKNANWEDNKNETLNDRARAYLDINCAHCHNPNGPAHTSGLNLFYEQPVNIHLGINKPPVASGKGSGDLFYNIIPGHPEQSILLYRMKSTDPGAMMPELGRQLVHQEGIELIREWIAKLQK